MRADIRVRVCCLFGKYVVVTNAPSLDSKLIDVAPSANTDDQGAKLGSDYSRLFHERFGPRTQEVDSRPSSGSTTTDEDETTWLRRVIEEDGVDVLDWKTPGQLGSLSVQFDDVLVAAPERGNGKSPKL